MRWMLVIAFCAAVAATTWAELRNDEPGLRLTIHDAMPFADPADPNPLGAQFWGVWPRFSVEPRCDGLRLTAGSRVLFNGRDVPRARETDASAGDTVVISARARCADGAHVEARRVFELPTASCDAGPLRVFDLQGSATSYDWNHEDGKYQLSSGDLVSPGSTVLVSRGGWIELGAPECNELRVRLFEGESTVGGYERGGRGDSFSGNRIFALADRHTGAFWVPGGLRGAERAMVVPTGDRTSFAVRSSPRRVVVRVWMGAALVSGGQGRRQVRVRAGEQVSVACPGARCSAGARRFFQPAEPWFSAAGSERLRSLVVGAHPPAARLAPRFARAQAMRFPAVGGAPAQIVVEWTRNVRRRSAATVSEQGVLIWQRVQPSRWRLVYSRRSPFGMVLNVMTGDVTGDGQADVLVDESMGSGGCGPRRVVAFAGGRTRQLFLRDFCEGDAVLNKGGLRLREGVGPCPYREMSAHCRGGTRTTIFRWHGARLASARASVRCVLPRLDPASNCARNRTQRRRNTA